jgi:lysophospholipase L1-like esterase
MKQVAKDDLKNGSQLLVFGDSHSKIWGGRTFGDLRVHPIFRGVKVHHLGAALAYNLTDDTNLSVGKWGSQVFEIIKTELAQGIASPKFILLCFGEIDVRTQIIPRAIFNETTLDESVEVVGQRILKFSELLYQRFQIPVLIWEPTPTVGLFYNPDLPAIGTEVERNYATKSLGQFLRSGAANLQEKYEIFSFGAYDALSFGMHTHKEYFEDGCHLNFLGHKLALAELDKLDKKHGLGVMQCFQIDDTKFKALASTVDITDQITISMTSRYGDQQTLRRSSANGYCFHTQKEHTPIVLLDLGCAMVIDSIRLRNRLDGYAQRAAHLAISVGNDPQKLERIYQSDETWGEDGSILELFFPQHPVRLISLRILAEDYFHLGEVTVLAKSFEPRLTTP